MLNCNQKDDIEEDFDVLPVVSYRDELINAIKKNRIIICIGETGSGKTTQIPQFCLDYGTLFYLHMTLRGYDVIYHSFYKNIILFACIKLYNTYNIYEIN